VGGTDVSSAATQDIAGRAQSIVRCTHDTRRGTDVSVATTRAIDGGTDDTGAVTDPKAASTDTSCDLADEAGVHTMDVKCPRRKEWCAEKRTGWVSEAIGWRLASRPPPPSSIASAISR